MSDIMEGIGTAASGGLFARVLEPESGAKAPDPHQPDNCLNCGTPLTGAYCSACGQSGHVHRTIGAFMHDLLHGALHFEGKLWRTLPMLVFRPGQLTRRYIEGQRARFVSPMALFLFSVFLMFAVFQMVGLTAPSTVNGRGLDGADLNGGVVAVDNNVEEQRAALREQLDTLAPGDPARAEVQEDLGVLDATQDGIEQLQEFRNSGLDESNVTLTGIEAIDAGLIAKWNENPGLMLYKLQANAYKFSWLLIPISIPFVWLVFAWKRRFRGYDHAIFVTYSLSFMTILFIVASLLGVARVPSALIGLLVMLIPPAHLYKQLRYAYDLSRFSAFWRLLVLSVFIWIIVFLFLEALLLLGAV
ncbi:MAG: DUF3667 domain-containing protein [Erythrobacter sp.]|nr:MAG: DUF3667 domain-containing protein [Erythrobacter sp.]